MKSFISSRLAAAILASASLQAVAVGSAMAADTASQFELTAQPLAKALLAVSGQTGTVIVAPSGLVNGVQAPALMGNMPVEQALQSLLAGSGLSYRKGQQGYTIIKEVSGASAGTEREKSSFVLEEIIVTATRRAESLQDVPIAISALNTGEMEKRGIENFADFARQLPGVIITENAKHFGKFAIRGLLDSTTTSGFSNKVVSIYIDDVPITSLSISTPDMRLYDMERVEVLRGPQGTLFGSSSIGGAVRIITNKPDVTNFTASANVDYGLTGNDSVRQRYNLMVNAPLVQDELAVRLVGYYRNEDGYIANVGTGTENADSGEDWGLRGSLRWVPNDRFTATAVAMYDKSDMADLSSSDPALGKHEHDFFWDSESSFSSSQYSLNLNYDFDGASLTSISTFANVDRFLTLAFDRIIFADGLVPAGYYTSELADTWLQELRLVSNTDSSVDWVLGGFFMDQKKTAPGGSGFVTTAESLDALNITGLPSFYEGSYSLSPGFIAFDSKEMAAYGELTWRFTDTLRLTGGLRYTKAKIIQKREAGGFNARGLVINAALNGGNAVIDLTPLLETASEIDSGYKSKLTKKISLTWQPTDEQTYYLLASEGFRTTFPNAQALVNGGVSTIDPNDPFIISAGADSDTLWNYEVGAKTRWFDGRLKANVAAYYIKWSDMQLQLRRLSDGALFVDNVGEATSKGIEAEIQAFPTDSLDLGVNITLQNARITKLTDEEALATGAVEGAGLASPKFQISGYVQHTWNLGNGQDVYMRIDAQYLGKYPNSLPNAPRSGTPSPAYAVIPSYENVNASVGWVSDHWKIIAYGENLFNNDDIIAINPVTYTAATSSTLRPRTFGVRASWKY